MNSEVWETWRARLTEQTGRGLSAGQMGMVFQELIRCLPSQLGEYVRSAASLGDPPTQRQRGLLPLPVDEFVAMANTTGLPPNRAQERAAWHWCLATILNFLGTGLRLEGAKPVPKQGNVVQRKAMERLAALIRWFLDEEDSGVPCEELAKSFRPAST